MVGYAFATPGQHWTYLGVGVLTSLATFVAGAFVGFLLGIPRAVSSGELRQNRPAAAGSSGASLPVRPEHAGAARPRIRITGPMGHRAA